MEQTAYVSPRAAKTLEDFNEFLVRIPDREPKKSIRVSIITVTYNSSATIGDTLRSVCLQNYRNIEHILVDGGSRDGTLEIIRSFPHVSKCISENDNGIYDAMNKGLQMATGDIIGILNSDDMYAHPEVISRVV